MGSKFWQKSHRNLTDIGTEIWKIFFANPAFRDWLHCWLEIGLIYRDTLPKTRFSLASKKQTGFRFDTFTMFKSILNNVKTKTWFPMKFKFASQLNTNLFHAEIQTWFKKKSKFAPRRTGSRFGEIDVALAEERLEPTLGRIIIHCHHLLYYHQCHIFVVTITILIITKMIIINDRGEGWRRGNHHRHSGELRSGQGGSRGLWRGEGGPSWNCLLKLLCYKNMSEHCQSWMNNKFRMKLNFWTLGDEKACCGNHSHSLSCGSCLWDCRWVIWGENI